MIIKRFVCHFLQAKLAFVLLLLIVCQTTHAQNYIDSVGKDSLSVPKDSLKIKSDTVLVDSAAKLPSKGSPLKSRVTYNAKDSMVFDLVGKWVYLYGAAKVVYEDINLEADYIKIDQKNSILYAEGLKDSTGKISGKPIFNQGKETFKCESIAYNFKTKKGKIKSINSAEGEGFLYGSEVKKNASNDFFVKNGRYSTCNLEHPHFYIGITKAKRKENTIVTGPAYMVVEDVPLPLGIPFGFFPRKDNRSSGILIPTVGEDYSLGFYLRDGGYYFGISDYIDLTIRANIYSKGSYGFNTSSSYKSLYHYGGNITVTYNNRMIGEKELPNFQQNKDFNINWTHTQDPKAHPGSSFTASVNAGTSRFYKNYSYNFNNIANNQLASSISYRKTWLNTPFNFSSSLTHSQNTNTSDISLGLPQINFSVSRISPFAKKNSVGKPKFYEKIGLSYDLNFRNEINTKDSLLFTPRALKMFRNGVQHSIPVSAPFTVAKYFTLTPSFNYNENWYIKTTRRRILKNYTGGDSTVVDTVNGFSRNYSYNTGASLNTTVFGMYNINKLGVKAIRHVVKPSVSYTFTPDFSTDKYNFYRTVYNNENKATKYSIYEQSLFGGPGTGKSSLMGFGVGNNLEMKVKSAKDTVTGTKKIVLLQDLSIRSAYNFQADSFQLQPFTLTARTSLFKNKIDLTYNSSYDPYYRTLKPDGTVERRYNIYQFNKKGTLATLTQAMLTVSTNLNADAFKSPKAASKPVSNNINQYDYDNILRNKAAYVDFNIPWTLNISYNLSYSPQSVESARISQILNFSGDVNVTPKWKIGFFSGYDFKTDELTSTSLNIYRDLHCWDLSVRWVPFGTYQSYSIDLKVKASLLQDLKLSRRREFYE